MRVIVDRPGDDELCTGSLVRDDLVLTAKHCFEFYKFGLKRRVDDPKKVTLSIGATRANGRVASDARAVARGAKFFTSSADMRLIQIDPVQGIAPLRIASTNESGLWAKDRRLAVYGWGTIEDGTISPELRVASATVLDAKLKSSSFRGRMKISTVNRRESGDSGGPLVSYTNGSPVQVGVLEAKVLGGPGTVAVRVGGASEHKWLSDLIKKEPRRAEPPRRAPQPSPPEPAAPQPSLPGPGAPPPFGAPPSPPGPGAPPPPPSNRPPVANFSVNRVTGGGNRVGLDGRASTDPDGSVSDWRWSVAGAPVGQGARTEVALGEATTNASITLTVTDDRGATASTTRNIATGNRAPVITGISPAPGTIVGSNTPRLDVAATDDDGEPLQRSYRITGPSTDVSSGWVGGEWTVPPYKLDPGTRYEWSVSVRDPRGATATRSSSLRVAMLPTATELVSLSTGDGYWQVTSDGGIFTYNKAPFYGSVPGLNIRVTNIIGMARTPDDKGYWIVGRDGGVFAFGNAPFAGSLGGQNINNIVGMAPTKDGRGYWLVGSDGGVFSFGTARFYGSMGGKPLNAPVQRIAPTASGNGYWLVARDGGIFSFGDAAFYGSMGGQPLNAPIIDIDVAPDGAGYWLTAEDGGVFTFGSAPFFGSLASRPLNGYITSMAPTPNGDGYWLNGCDGGIFTFGNAAFYGSNPTKHCRGT